MQKTQLNFLNILFDAGEQICFTSSVYGTNVAYGWENFNAHNTSYFAINPLHTQRLDANVTCYRNILIEFDSISRSEQFKLLRAIPYSTAVWSGNKSMHIIISLKQPLASREEYNALVKQIYSALPAADQSTKNPSRLSRLANARHANGKLQRIISLRSRLELKDVKEKLKITAPLQLKPQYENYTRLSLSKYTKYYLFFGAQEGSRNNELFMAACDMFRCGFSQAEIIDKTASVCGLSTSEQLSAIKSAYRTVARDFKP